MKDKIGIDKNGKYYVKVFVKGIAIFRREFKNKVDAEIVRDFLSGNKQQANRYCKDYHNLFEEHLKEDLSKTSYYRYMSVIKMYVYSYLDNIKVNQISSALCYKINDHVNRLKLKSKANILYCFKKFLTFIKVYNPDLEFTETNFYIKKKYLLRKELRNKMFDFYTQEEFKRFYSVIKNPRDKLIFIILYYYGLRVEELIGLRIEDFTNDYMMVHRVITSKTDGKGQETLDIKTESSYRELSMSKTLNEALMAYLNEMGHKRRGVLFPSKKKGKVLSPTEINRLNKKYAEESNLRKIKIHEFRHSCATILINNGLDVLQVSNWLGHSSPDVTLRTYSHLFNTRKKDITTFIDASFNK